MSVTLPLNHGIMKTIVHRADQRGSGDYGWLLTHHSFNFGTYFSPERGRFGALRVLNDDRVAPGKGFGTHPHDNMEIVTIPLEGVLLHTDSMGHEYELTVGEVQAMSAGTGLTHSEYNSSNREPVSFLQIWVIPRERDLLPRYGQKIFPLEERHNALQLIVSPDGRENSLPVNQDAFFHLGSFDADREISSSVHNTGSGVYAFVIDGAVTVGDDRLEKRDAIGVWDTDSFSIHVEEPASLLLIEVPMI